MTSFRGWKEEQQAKMTKQEWPVRYLKKFKGTEKKS